MKKTIITALLALAALTGWAQSTKTATVTGYSPALKDGTLVLAGTGTIGNVVDTVQTGRFDFTLPVEELTDCFLSFMGDGCPNFNLTIFLSPGVNVKVSGTDCLYPLWKVESPLPEQQTESRITEHCHDVIAEYLQMSLANKPWAERDSVEIKYIKQQMDILPSLPVDAATIRALWGISLTAKNTKDFPYMEQLKQLEKRFVARKPKGFEERLAEIHNKKAVDAELIDLQGQKHHLSEVLGQQGKYVLLDFWGIGCGPCMMSVPEISEVYNRMKDKLEIVGINQNRLSEWQKHEFTKRIVWKNWNNATKDISSRYCDMGAIPYYILISPEGRILWKAVGYGPGWFLGMAESFNCPKQDNSSNLSFVVRHVEANAGGTKVSFRYYGKKGYWFRIAKESYLTANGKKYKLTAADGIKLDVDNYPEVNAFTAKEEYIGEINYSDFTLTFEPFETIPETFDFKEGDGEGAFVIRNISLK